MPQKFIMTAFGEDRPGFIADVTQVLYEHGCNLEDSTMTRLEDEFVLIVLFTGRGDHLEDQLSRACRHLEREKGISAFLRPVEPQRAWQKRKVSTHTLHVKGVDHVGIVYHISKYLAEHQVNIMDLHSHLEFSPESGTAIYTLQLHLEIPEETAMDQLKEGLARVGNDLCVDITF